MMQANWQNFAESQSVNPHILLMFIWMLRLMLDVIYLQKWRSADVVDRCELEQLTLGFHGELFLQQASTVYRAPLSHSTYEQ